MKAASIRSRWNAPTRKSRCRCFACLVDIQRLVAQLRDSGIGVLITDHNVRETLKVTDRAYIINNGRIFRDGRPSELGTDPEVKRVYLGENFVLEH